MLGPPGSQLGSGGFNQPDLGDGNRLWNLAPRMPAGDGDPVTGAGAANWSRINNGVRELIDHILVSHLLVHALESTESRRGWIGPGQQAPASDVFLTSRQRLRLD